MVYSNPVYDFGVNFDSDSRSVIYILAQGLVPPFPPIVLFNLVTQANDPLITQGGDNLIAQF